MSTKPIVSMGEGRLVEWRVEEGSEIAAGDVVAEIEVGSRWRKRTEPVKSAYAGKIHKIMVDESGQYVHVHDVIAEVHEIREYIVDYRNQAEETEIMALRTELRPGEQEYLNKLKAIMNEVVQPLKTDLQALRAEIEPGTGKLIKAIAAKLGI